VLGQDWAKTTIRDGRRTRWHQEILRHLRPDRRTLLVTTLECVADVRAMLDQHGIDPDRVAVEHYGSLRGSNAYRGYDVILTQIYHPNLDGLIREGRALFADDPLPLDEQIQTVERPLTDASGATWLVSVPTFVDPRLAALLEARREAEMVQCALRGRPLDHPDVQITILSSLPLPGLAPTAMQHAQGSPRSNGQRQEQIIDRLCAAAQQLLDSGNSLIDALMLAQQAHASVTTVRNHWRQIAQRLNLDVIVNRRRRQMPRGGEREYVQAALVRRQIGILASKAPPAAPVRTAPPAAAMIDQARNMPSITRLIDHHTMIRTPPIRHQRIRSAWHPGRAIRGPP
jgi:hypothetical protein